MFKTLPALILSLAVVLGSQAVAQEETPWVGDNFSKARLVVSHKSVPRPDEGPLYAGLHIQMDKGWKTYWRSPGDAGFPPSIDWAGSVNVAAVEFLFPAPDKFEIFGLVTYGYHDEVVYPVKVTPAIEGAPVTLNASVNYLVCKDLCVPENTTLKLALPAANGPAALSPNSGLIDRYLKRVPSLTSDKIEITNVALLGVPGTQNLKISIAGNDLMTGATVIAENIEGFTFSDPARRVMSASSQAEFVISVYSQTGEGDLAGKTVTLTIADGWGHFEEKQVFIQ